MRVAEDIKNSLLDKQWTSSVLSGKYGPAIALLLISATGFIIYSNAFHGPFLVDDGMYVVDNPKIRNLGNFLDISGTRYIAFLTFALNYAVGGYNTFGYHLVNIIIHIINGFLVWWLVVLTFKTPVMERTAGNPQLKYFIALSSAIIFVSHPVQTQAVTYITQRFASLATLFYLLALVLYIKSRLADKVGSSKVKWVFYFGSLLSAVLAMKTKEISFTLPLIIILYEFVFFSGKGLRQRLPYIIPFLLTLAIVPLNIFAPEFGLGKTDVGIDERIRGFQIRDLTIIPRYDYLVTQFRVIVTYIRLLFFPVNQNLDYDYPVYSSLFEAEVFLSFLFLLSIFAFAIYLYRSRIPCLVSRIVPFGILWFFITLSVESSVIPISDVMFEHRLYLPSIGMIIAFSSAVFYGADYAKKRLRLKVSLPVATCVLLLVTAVPLSFATYKRNWVWKDEVVFWMDVVGKSPSKARVYNALGNVYAKQGRIDEAIEKYREALELNPANAAVHYNLGLVYAQQDRMDEAIEEYREALRLKTDVPEIYYNMGNAYYVLGRIGEAIEAFRKASTIEPDFADAHYNLGNAYYNQGQVERAIEEFRETLRINPDFADAHNNLGNAYYNQGQVERAIEEFRKALTIEPDFADAHNNLGNVYLLQNHLDEAIEEYISALRLEPDYVNAHFNLGLAYKKKGLNDEAIREFKKVLEIKPDHVEAREILNSISR